MRRASRSGLPVEGPYAWSDRIAVTAACDIVRLCRRHPTDGERRALYKDWLRVYGSQQWEDAFDGLLLQCVMFTPSPTSPAKALFGDCFTLAASSTWDPVLDTSPMSGIFARSRGGHDVERSSLSPSSYHGLAAFIADLLSSESIEALNEAGLLIGFCSLLLVAASLQSAPNVQAVFTEWAAVAPSSLFGTSFEGRVPCPQAEFLASLTEKAVTFGRSALALGAVLAVAQYVLLKKPGADVREKDLAFLQWGFLTHTQHNGLQVVELLSHLSSLTGLTMEKLNALVGGDECRATRRRVEQYLRQACGPGGFQYSIPWCRTLRRSLFKELELEHNVAYALRIKCFLGQERGEAGMQLCAIRAIEGFGRVTAADLTPARLWAKKFGELLRKGFFRPDGDAGTSV